MALEETIFYSNWNDAELLEAFSDVLGLVSGKFSVNLIHCVERLTILALSFTCHILPEYHGWCQFTVTNLSWVNPAIIFMGVHASGHALADKDAVVPSLGVQLGTFCKVRTYEVVTFEHSVIQSSSVLFFYW